jgi:hypothetical protein
VNPRLNDEDDEQPQSTGRRLVPALIAYGILTAAGLILLSDKVLIAFLILMAAFVAKTLIAWKAGW